MWASLTLALVGLGACQAAVAIETSQEPSPLRLYGRGGLSTGGSTIKSGTYVNTGTTYDIRAGGGVTFAVGAEWQVTDAIAVQATVGTQSEKTDATDGEAKFSRRPKEVVVFYQLAPQWKLGAGARQDTDVQFSMRKDGVMDRTWKFDDASGKVLELQYLFSPRDKTVRRSLQAGFSLRFIQQSHREPLSGERYGGNQLGLNFFAYY